MTIREYIENNVEDVVMELCQYQSCDNCSIGGMNWENCPLKKYDIAEAINKEFDSDFTGEEEDND